MDLASLNPIISYRGQYFTSTWSDMIGTNMFFCEPSHDSEASSPLLQGDGFTLEGTSRIKLIAQKAKITAKPGRKKRSHAQEDVEDMASEGSDEEPVPMTGKALGTLRSNNPRLNMEIRTQAKFLERLMDIKRKKGETDNVRTAFPFASSSKPDRSTPATSNMPRTREEYANEIEQLNRRVVRGDRDALFRLEEIYEQMDDERQGQRQASGTPDMPTTTDATPGADAFDEAAG